MKMCNNEFTIQKLISASTSDILACFNTAFKDYYVKIEMTETILLSKIRNENISLLHSIGAWKGDLLVGIILIGLDNFDNPKMAYNAGTGVLPNHRGNNLGVLMYSKFMVLYPSIRNHVLEVISENIPAINIYLKLGYKSQRSLLCFRGLVSFTSEMASHNSITVRNGRYFRDIDSLVFDDCLPSWQNSLSTIARSYGDLHFLEAYFESEFAGYCVIEKETNRIKQIFVIKSFRRMGIASSFFHYLSKQRNSALFSMNNIDASEHSLIGFVESIGMKRYVEQYEMVLNENA